MKNFRISTFKHVSVTLIAAFVITACGGGGESDNDSNTPDVSSPVASMGITASNVSKAVYEEQATVVNLSSSIITTEGGTDNVKLSKVTPVTNSASCQDNYTYTQDLNFTVEGEGVGVCVYKYEVQSTDGTASATAYAQVAIAGSDSALVSNIAIEPISAVAQLTETITVDTTAPTASDGETFELQPTTSVLGSGTVDDVDTSTGVITYTSGSGDADTGVTRILYYYQGSEGTVLTGAVDVTVSTDTSNTAPTASNWTYVTNADLTEGITYTALSVSDTVTIDLASPQYTSADVQELLASDPDGDSLQLVSLTTFNADATIDDPDDPNTSSFTFNSNQTGNYYVTYTVTDHNGGYASGVIEFRVEGTWPDVLVSPSNGEQIYFLAPLSFDDTIAAGYAFTGIADESSSFTTVTDADGNKNNGHSNVPTFTWAQANAICIARGGRLPTNSELYKLQTQEGNAFLGPKDPDSDTNVSTSVQQAENWPISRYYFTSTFNTYDSTGDSVLAYPLYSESDIVNDPNTTSTTYQTQSVNTAEIVTSNDPYLGYFTCVDETAASIEITNSILLKDVEGQQLTATYKTAAGNSSEYTNPLNWYVNGDVDPSLTAMDDIPTNVQLELDGEFNATAEGYIHVIAETPSGDLTASKDINVMASILGITGLDLTFESFPNATSLSCNYTKLEDEPTWPSVDRIVLEHNYGVEHGIGVVSDCDDAISGDSYLSIRPEETVNNAYRRLYLNDGYNDVAVTAGQKYVITFWVRSQISDFDYAFAKIVGDTVSSIGLFEYVTLGGKEGISPIIGTHNSGDWTKYWFEFTPTKDDTISLDLYFRTEAEGAAVDVDDILVFPIES